MLVALDTNILVYAEGFGASATDQEKSVRLLSLLEMLPPDSIIVPVQVLGDLYRVLVGKAAREKTAVRTAIAALADLYRVAETTLTAMQAAMDLAVDHRLSIWDAVVLAVAAEARCRVVLSEDMQHGFTWRGLTVINPLAGPHPLLEVLASGGDKR